MALSVHSWHSIRLSAHEGVLAGAHVGGEVAPGPRPGPLHEPRAEWNAKNETIRPLISRK